MCVVCAVTADHHHSESTTSILVLLRRRLVWCGRLSAVREFRVEHVEHAAEQFCGRCNQLRRSSPAANASRMALCCWIACLTRCSWGLFKPKSLWTTQVEPHAERVISTCQAQSALSHEHRTCISNVTAFVPVFLSLLILISIFCSFISLTFNFLTKNYTIFYAAMSFYIVVGKLLLTMIVRMWLTFLDFLQADCKMSSYVLL